MLYLFSKLAKDCQWKVVDGALQSFKVLATATNDVLKARGLEVGKVGHLCVLLANLSLA